MNIESQANFTAPTTVAVEPTIVGFNYDRDSNLCDSIDDAFNEGF